MEPLPLPSGHRAVVTVPIGATAPRPIVVGVHGAADRAEWACGGYRAATGSFPFVICPEGLPAGSDKFSTSPAGRLRVDIDAAINATRAKFGPYVAEGSVLYAGFSLGAMHGVEVVARQAAEFPRVLLLEGGFREWTGPLARAFVQGGGERVMLVCAGRDCRATCGQAERELARAGVKVTIVAAGTGRHNLDGEMAKVLARHWGWLVGEDSRWAAWTPPALP